MNKKAPKKCLMEGYVGVKFNAVQRAKRAPFDVRAFYPAFRRVCERLKENDMTCANAGNLSVRHQDGLIVTSTGSNLGCLEKNELVFIDQCNADEEKVFYYGPIKPSSETIMHWLIYQKRPEALAIIHAHDEFATCSKLLEGRVHETGCEKPYGSVELARTAIETFERAERIIVLKNHGYVAVGNSLDEACDLVVATHLKLSSASPST